MPAPYGAGIFVRPGCEHTSNGEARDKRTRPPGVGTAGTGSGTVVIPQNGDVARRLWGKRCQPVHMRPTVPSLQWHNTRSGVGVRGCGKDRVPRLGTSSSLDVVHRELPGEHARIAKRAPLVIVVEVDVAVRL